MQHEIKKKSYLWNSAAGIINASEAVLILAFVGRLGTVEDAGILTLSFSIANLAMTVGKFGVRTYQVTGKEKSDFFDFLCTRILTFLLMLVIVALYLSFCFFAENYSFYKCNLILAVVALYGVEVIEDVFLSEYQKRGRLDISSRIFFFRWLFSLMIICFSMFFVSLTLSVIIAVVFSAVFCCIVLRIANEHIGISVRGSPEGNHYKSILSILYSCFSLFLSGFMSLYANNIQKYAIDHYLSEDLQAVYGYIAMPVFVLPLLCNFIIQPVLVELADVWNSNEYRKFLRQIQKDMMILLLLFALCEAGAYILGIPVLSLLYNVDLTAYRFDLLILLFGGLFLAVGSYISCVFTIMRKQFWSMLIYVFGAIAGTAFAFPLVRSMGIRGASLSYLLSVFLIAAACIFVFVGIYWEFCRSIEMSCNSESCK